MNQKNTLKSMIPQRIVELVPSSSRDNWANLIVDRFKESTPALYAAVGQWSFIPEDELNAVVNKILEAAENIYLEIRKGALSL